MKNIINLSVKVDFFQIKSNIDNNLIIDIAVNFRAKLRQLALHSNTDISKQDLLKLCDTLRNDLSTVNIIVQVNNLSTY